MITAVKKYLDDKYFQQYFIYSKTEEILKYYPDIREFIELVIFFKDNKRFLNLSEK